MRLVAIISHDAGGAEILSSYILKHNLDYLYVLDGPALKIFQNKLGPIKIISLESAVSQSEAIICGTSWQSDLEFEAIKLARLLGKHSTTFLDHWVNYNDRFVRSNITVLPDEIWVFDSIAEVMAKKAYPITPIYLKDNPYLYDVRKEFLEYSICNQSRQDSISILYVCEPIGAQALLRHGCANHWGYMEDDALRYFLANISALGQSVNRILIRPHPSEPIDKYNWVQQEFKLPIKIGGARPLLEEISCSEVVVGCQSMAMVVALQVNKVVISCIPPGGKACALPHKEILSFQKMIESPMSQNQIVKINNKPLTS